ncbi:hypothetical protein Lqui_0907 [Legionella quinlivanii]|uniref:Uncharacterized protein n=1 Tax=Legionella quinlivanii TaxID=45073 RepID=A0A0W0Y5V7_9GAMM|nr:hypothetical protein [Legionella quinlivanii]KTD52063.1 hypothetical protein Lqui_0907 [Legionella quinlivanii]MCW8452327.1 hypothetical protein [Legionella quinlivanii]SEF89016.1 hypothetical protein SAMN02746093_01370 [Legionella quinlivanii DSM 21216]STY12441.1 Uncharacterised protein [Legionella quinlivanii]
MKKIALILCLLPVISFATPKEDAMITVYQERCAKEQDPVKRQNYCHALEQVDTNTVIADPFRQDVAIV